MANEDFLSPRKKIKDMDRRPLPTHIDDIFVEEDENETWVPGKKTPRKRKPSKKKNANKAPVEEVDFQENIGKSIDIMSKIFVILISLGALVGIVALSIWAAGIYGIDLIGSLQQAIQDTRQSLGL